MFKNKIKELRFNLRLNQQQLGNKLNLSKEAISSYETGRAFPDVKTLIKLSEFFNVSTDYLLGRSDEDGIIINNELSQIENYIVDQYRNFNTVEQKELIMFIDYLNSKK